MIFLSKRSVTLALLASFVTTTPASAQLQDLYNKVKKQAQGQINNTVQSSTAARSPTMPPFAGDQISVIKWHYEHDKSTDKAKAQDAFAIASLYERKEDYVNAATWYRNSYTKGGLGGSKGFVDLILLNKISIDNPENIRPFVELLAICGSKMSREYVFAHWHETPGQIPEHSDEKLIECGPVGPEDVMQPQVMNEARRRQQEQELAKYYRQHPEEDPKLKAQKAAEGAALLLGALMIQASNMPSTGPGSIACNKYTNKYPGYTDPSVCFASPAK